MCNFRGKWEINLRNCNALHSTVSYNFSKIKSSYPARHSKVKWSTADNPVAWLLFPQWGVEFASFRTDTSKTNIKEILPVLSKRFCWFYKRYLFLTCYNGGSYVRKYMFEIVFFLIILLKHVARPEI